MRCAAVALALAACGSSGGGTVAKPGAPTGDRPEKQAPSEPPVSYGQCIPLQFGAGLGVPEPWRADRKSEGSWQFNIWVNNDIAVAVRFDRLATCSPAAQQEPPLDPAYPPRWKIDARQTGTSTNDGVTTSDEACVLGKLGALIATVYPYPAEYRPQITKLLVWVAEATDGAHSCTVF